LPELSWSDSLLRKYVKITGRFFGPSLLCICISLTVVVRAWAGPDISANEAADSVELGAPLQVYEPVYSSTGTVTFQWNKDSVPIPSQTGQTLYIPAVTAGDAGTYSVSVSDVTGVTTATVAIVTVDAPTAPIIVTPPQPNNTVDGNQATFSVVTSGSLPQTYQWEKNNQPIAGATSQSFTINAASLHDGGNYSVIVSNSTGNTQSASALLTVGNATAPAIVSQPQGNTYSYGGYLQLYSAASGSSPMFVQWFRNGVAIPGANQNGYYVSYATPAYAGTYMMTAINAAGWAASSEVQVTVAPATLSIAQQPTPQTTLQATSPNFSLSVSVNGSSPMTFQWFKNGSPITGATTSQFVIPYVQLSDAGSYVVSISNPAGSVQSNPAVLVVTPPAPPATTYFNNSGKEARATVGSTFYVYPEGSVSSTLTIFGQWFFNGQAIPGATATELAISNFNSSNVGDYVLKYSTAGGSVVTAPVEVNAEIAPYPANVYSWMDAQVLGSVAYFLFSSPGQIMRYDMSAQQWLAPFALPATPTAMRVSPEGIYVSFGQTATLYPVDFATPGVPLPNTAVSTTQIFLDPNYAYFYGIQNYDSGDFTAVSRSNQTLVATTDTQATYISDFQQISASPTGGKAFGWEAPVEPSSLVAFTLVGDGTVSGFNGFATGAGFAPNARTYISGDGATLVSYDGGVYDVGSLTYRGMLAAGGLDDICFLSDGKILALRGNQYSLYDPSTLALTAKWTAASCALKIFEQGTTIFGFSPPSLLGGTPVVTTAIESTIAAAALAPVPALSASAAQAVSVVPADSFIDKNGLVYLLDRLDENILVWSPTQRKYLTSIPLTGFPDQFAYSGTLHRIYVTYPDGRMTHIDLSNSDTEAGFATVSSAILNMTAVDNQLYVHLSDPYDSGEYRALYSSTGQLVATTTFGYFSSESDWDSATQSLYDVVYDSLEALPVQNGAFGTNPVTNSNDSLAFNSPFRFSPDGSLMVTANGLVFNTTTLAAAGTLGGPFTDASWLGSSVYGLISSSTGSAVQQWSGSNYLLANTTSLTGAPDRIWSLAGSQVMALTSAGSGPIFTVLNAAGTVVSVDSNSGIPSLPPVLTSFVAPPNSYNAVGSDLSIAATAMGTGDTYQWMFNGSAITGATSPTLDLNNVQQSESGNYQLVVSNAFGQTDSQYDFLTIVPESSSSLTVTAYPVSTTALSGGVASFSIVATGVNLAYQWSFQGVPIPGATGSVLNLPGVLPEDDGTYTVTVTANGGGQGNSYQYQANLTVVLNSKTAEVCDLNGDGKSDILWQNSTSGSVGAWLMNGISLQGWTSTGTAAAGWQIVGTGSFDITGDTDILWQNSTTGEVGAWMMNGTAFSSWVSMGTASPGWKVVGTGFFDGTGNTDILWQNSSTGEVGAWLMNGTAFSSWVSIGTASSGWQIVGTGSFDSTGNTDILWQNASTGEVGMWLMNGAAFSSWVDIGTASVGWKIVGSGFFDGSGNTDILWQNSSTGQVGLWLMNGTAYSSWMGIGNAAAGWGIVNH
jgi:hypothetical protein